VNLDTASAPARASLPEVKTTTSKATSLPSLRRESSFAAHPDPGVRIGERAFCDTQKHLTATQLTARTGVNYYVGGAHGHGPRPITNGERTLLSAWLKQGHDWLML
jgi:hypothetical protein